MKINVLNEEKTKLLSRIELNVEIVFEGKTPSKEEVKKAISKLKKKNEELIVVKNIYVKFGSNTANSLIYIYENKKEMEKIEPKVKEVVKKKKKEKPKEEPKPGEKENGKGKDKKEENK